MKSDSRTIELVGPGHSDRFCDFLAETILVAHLRQDNDAKVAVEIMATRNKIFLGGEISSRAKINYKKLIYDAIKKVYGEKFWPNFSHVKIINNIKEQSQELHTIQEKKIVAGDQGVIYGYYSKHRYEIITFLYQFVDYLKEILWEEFSSQIANDWKLLFNEQSKELSISLCGIKLPVINQINNHFKILKSKPSITDFEKKLTKYLISINKNGEWLIGGPLSDTGMVGRKLMVETFGAGIPHGGGAFCGKDFSKVDKSGILIATELAKKISETENIPEVFVQLTYLIGDECPKLFASDLFNVKKIDLIKYQQIIKPLDQWINDSKVKSYDWADIALHGGVVAFFQKYYDNPNH